MLRTAPPGYVLAVEPTYVDANRFRRLVEEARAGEAAERAAKLREALDLWRGRALADFTYEPFAQREIAALEELRIAVMEDRIDADLTLGLASELVADIETLVAEHPSRERLRAQLSGALPERSAGGGPRGVPGHAASARGGPRNRAGHAFNSSSKRSFARTPSSRREPAPARTQVALEPPSPGKPWLQGERKIVTVAFLDLGASSVIRDGFDPEALRRVVARSRDVAAEILVRHGATVEHVVGDVVVESSAPPLPTRTTRSAPCELRSRSARRWDGLTPPRGRELPFQSAPASRRARSSSAARAQDGRRSPATRCMSPRRSSAQPRTRMCSSARRPSESSEAPRCEPVDALTPTAWRLVGLVPGAQALARHLDAPMVGRDADLARVVAAFERAVRDDAGSPVLGDAGIGKSRLGREVAAALGSRARILTGRCPAYGDGVTFWPLPRSCSRRQAARESIRSRSS